MTKLNYSRTGMPGEFAVLLGGENIGTVLRGDDETDWHADSPDGWHNDFDSRAAAGDALLALAQADTTRQLLRDVRSALWDAMGGLTDAGYSVGNGHDLIARLDAALGEETR